MLNEGAVVPDSDVDKVLKVLDGVELKGGVNTADEQILDNIKYAVRQGITQVRPQPPNFDRVALVGGGPSLNDPQVFQELRDLVWSGAKLVTMNGAYHWCMERNLQPRTQIVVDARDSNARFVNPPVPDCRYVLASQCHSAVWDAVKDRPGVFIFHIAPGDKDDQIKPFLDGYYRKQWYGIGGATTVATRAISVLRTLGYLRFDLFGVDSCWMDGWRLRKGGNYYRHGGTGEIKEYPNVEAATADAEILANDYGDSGWRPVIYRSHHAYDQPENNRDGRRKVTVGPSDRPDLERTFRCAPWHMKQAEDFLQLIRINGDNFLLTAHGDGMIAHLLRSGADAVIRETEEQGSPSE